MIRIAAAISLIILTTSGCAVSEPLKTALSQNDLPGIQRALNSGADINARFAAPPETPLEFACVHGQFDALKLLIDKGASTASIKTRTGTRSALTVCVAHRRLDMVRYLVEHGAPISSRARSLARTRPEIQSYLLSLNRKLETAPTSPDSPDDGLPEPPEASPATAAPAAPTPWWAQPDKK